MSKTWLFNFLCVLMICSSSHCMNFVFNMSSETRLMRNIRNASEFLNKNGWTMFITGTAVATLCCYDKPVMWHAGVVGFNGLLMYKFIQMQKHMNALAQQLEETNTKTIKQNEACQSQLNDVKAEQEKQKQALTETVQKIDDFLPKLDAHTAATIERFNSFNKENIEPLRKDIKGASAELSKLNKEIINDGKRQTALGDKVGDLHVLLMDVSKKQEAIVADHTNRFTVIEEKIESGFARLDACIATSFGEIKEHLSKKGIAWQGNKQIGFGRQAAGGLISPLSSVIKLHSSNSSTP